MWFVVLIVGDWLLPTVDFPSIHHAIPKYSFKSDADTWVFKRRFPTLQNPKHGKKKTKKSKKSKKSKNNDNELLTNPQVKSRDQGMGSHRWLLMAVEDLSRRLRWIMFPSSCLSQQNIPPDLSQCVFVIEQALSVRALQELVTAAGSEAVNHFIHSLTHSSIDWPIHSLAHSFIGPFIHPVLDSFNRNRRIGLLLLLLQLSWYQPVAIGVIIVIIRTWWMGSGKSSIDSADTNTCCSLLLPNRLQGQQLVFRVTATTMAAKFVWMEWADAIQFVRS